MLIELLLSPWANLCILPPKVAALCLVLSGSISGLSMGFTYARAHIASMPEICITVVSTIVTAACLALLLHINLLQRWEDNFDSLPWRQQSLSTGQPSTFCPFTGSSRTGAPTHMAAPTHTL